MKIDLIKQMNESIKEKDQFEQAIEKTGVKLKEMDDEFMGDIDPDMNQASYEASGINPEELERIAQAYVDPNQGERPMGAPKSFQGSAEEMSTNELMDRIGDDLEQLGYDPEDIETGIEEILSMLGREYSPEENEEEFALPSGI